MSDLLQRAKLYACGEPPMHTAYCAIRKEDDRRLPRSDDPRQAECDCHYGIVRSLIAENELLRDRLAETNSLALGWMEAHDKLKAGLPYRFPSTPRNMESP